MSIAIEPGSREPTLPPLIVEPVARAALTQRWSDVVFLPWRYDPALVQRLLPPGVRVDTHDGSAWVALVPFQMERLRIPGLPPLPFVGAFPEVNVRTYVHAGDRRGVWFFSLDVDTLLAAAVARIGYRLPYCHGRVDHVRHAERLASRVVRRWPRLRVADGGRSTPTAAARIEIRAGSAIQTGDPLTRFLTARWGLISSSPVARFATPRSTMDRGRCTSPSSSTSRRT